MQTLVIYTRLSKVLKELLESSSSTGACSSTAMDVEQVHVSEQSLISSSSYVYLTELSHTKKESKAFYCFWNFYKAVTIFMYKLSLYIWMWDINIAYVILNLFDGKHGVRF